MIRVGYHSQKFMIEYFIGSSELMDNRLLLNIISAINDS